MPDTAHPAPSDPAPFDPAPFDPAPFDPQRASPPPAYRAPSLRSRHDGWTVERQRHFLGALAETGCVAAAADAVGMTARSAYRLRLHPRAAAFAHAWTQAQLAAGHRLLAVAYDRAINGAVRTVWKDGEIVSQTRVPSDRMAEFLLAKTMPHLFGPTTAGNAFGTDRVGSAQRALPAALDGLAAISVDDLPVGPADFDDEAPEEDPAMRC
ncbi:MULTISPECIES: hypothetical protein [unclassified Sphingomonas]|uniref:hypothetical protein n=1 Tax=unclassified Sphingomonas TaxID=196159 RepID=UPI000E106DFB|nr:hypothetical protein [Sphingomonas sp. FARSPH]AXJ95854.1 hypothetical protein DM480_10375 [Sphingomonas sp. FARSPH]